MRKLILHTDALADLDHLWEIDPDSAAELEALLDEVRGSQDLMDRLTQHDFGAVPTRRNFFNTKMWVDQQKQDNNLWRIKFWELEELGIQYRIIYAFFPVSKQHHVLGIMPRKNRDFDYNRNDPRTIRMLKAYEELCEVVR